MTDQHGSGPSGPPAGGAGGPGGGTGTGRRISALTAAILGIVAVVAVALLILRPWEEDEGPTDASSATATVSAVAPLTGTWVTGDRVPLLDEPALAVKIDAAPQANGQWGLGRADVVLEEQVEGIGRFLAVWHSDRAEEVGPVRSARSTDVSLLPMLVRPLFAHSGANEGVLAEISEADGFQDVSVAEVPDAYRRDSSAAAPHNLLADPEELQEAAEEPYALPVPLFTFREDGDPVPGESVPGVEVTVGSTAAFVWDEAVPGWRRWSHGEAQVDHTGEQVAPTNLVVLLTDYVASAADPDSPEAVSLGGGEAWVYSAGAVQEGRWIRRAPEDPWDLLSSQGGQMTLQPGTTWVVLATAAPRDLSADASAALLAEAEG